MSDLVSRYKCKGIDITTVLRDVDIDPTRHTPCFYWRGEHMCGLKATGIKGGREVCDLEKSLVDIADFVLGTMSKHEVLELYGNEGDAPIFLGAKTYDRGEEYDL
jgi:hypothetical protein